jgi:type II secretory pathway component HofQ
VKLSVALLVAVLWACPSFAQQHCTGNPTISMNFRDLNVITAYSIMADFAGCKLVMDDSIQASGPMHFTEVPWRDVAQSLANEYKLTVEIRDGIMTVRKR